MPRHFAAYIGGGQRSPGVVVVPRHLAVAEVASQLLLIANATSSEDWVDRICYLPL
jgi:hypothetical protein